eukprot:6626105-Alexandrium_andersonii.AAC.1
MPQEEGEDFVGIGLQASKPQQEKTCSFCRKQGHIEAECDSKHGKPNSKGKNSKGKGKGKGENSKGKGVRNINEEEQWGDSTGDSEKPQDWSSPPGVNT